ncbi:MAG: 50S ribosomal protein L10 [Gemmataceae bacterium]
MSKVIKQMEMDDLRRTFDGVRDLVVLSVEKLGAQATYALRSTMRKKQIRLKVVKNSLARKVFKELNLQIPDDSPVWQKPSVVAWGGSSIKDLSQALQGELKAPKLVALYRDKVTVKGAVADGQACSFEDALKMPTRTEIIAELVGMILGPASAIAGCLVGPASQIASQIEQIGEKKEDAAPTTAG